MTKTEMKKELEIFKNDYTKNFLSGNDIFNHIAIKNFGEATMIEVIDEAVNELSKKIPYGSDVYELIVQYSNADYDMEKEEFLFVKSKIFFDIFYRFNDKYINDFIEHDENELFW